MRITELFKTAGHNRRIILAASIASALAFAACERKSATVELTLPSNPAVQPQPAEPVAVTSTFETARLGEAIDTFEKVPTVENQSSVRLAFAKLDGEIAELQDRVVRTNGQDRADASAKLNNLQNYRDAETIRFTKAQNGMALDANRPADGRSVAQKAGDTAVMVGDKVEDGTRKAGRTLERAAEKTGEVIHDATH